MLIFLLKSIFSSFKQSSHYFCGLENRYNVHLTPENSEKLLSICISINLPYIHLKILGFSPALSYINPACLWKAVRQHLNINLHLCAGLCSSRAWWPLAPNFFSWMTRKSQIFSTNHMLGTLDFTCSAQPWCVYACMLLHCYDLLHLLSTGRKTSTESGWDGNDSKRFSCWVWGTCIASERRGISGLNC